MPLPFEPLARFLARRGMPGAEVGRYVEELRDHREDLILEFERGGSEPEIALRLADEQLGSTRRLAEAALAAHRKRFFMGRHPWFFFVILPALAVPLIIILLMVVTIIGVLWMSHALGKQPADWPAYSWQAVDGGAQIVNYLWPGLLGLPIYRAAWRRGMGLRWRVFSGGIVAVWGAWLHCAVRAGDATHHGMFTMGSQALPYLTQGASAVVIMALYAWRLDRRACRRLLPRDDFALADGVIT